jgi:adhesin transport system outer membrane protein
MNLLLKKINLIFIIITFIFTSSLAVSADTLSTMVEGLLESHEDIINSKKELEEASRDVTDAMLVYAPDLSIKYEGGQNNKHNAGTNSNVDAFHTYDLTWKQKIMDSGASMADVRNKNLSVQKKELELVTARNDLLIEAADAYLGLIKASEKLEASVAAEANTRQTTGQEEIRVQVGSGLASDVLKAKRQLASAQKTVISDEKSFKAAMYTYEKLFDVSAVDVDNLTKPRLAPSTLSMVPKSMEATVEMALSGNRDLQIAKIDVETAKNDLSSALANFGPTVDAEGKYSHKDDASHTAGHHYEEQFKVTVEFPISGLYMEMPGYLNDRSALDRAINDLVLKERDTIKTAKDAWVEFANARTLLSYSENEATIAKELLSIAQKERAADQTDAAAVLSAEEALEGALKDLSDDSMSLLTTVYEILDVINLLEPDMVEDTSKVGTFNTPS